MKLADCQDNIPRMAEYRIEHPFRVAHIAAEIAQAEGLDEEKAYVAGLLHDIGYSVDFKTKDEYSPVETNDFSIFPPAYIETAEFDCLHDDGILFAEELKAAGAAVELNETKGTMRGYDIMRKASGSLDSMKRRIAFMKGRLEQKTGKEQ